MPRRPLTLRALAPCLLALVACHPWVVGNGEYEEQHREVGAFIGVSVQNAMLVEVTSGVDVQSVTVSGDENVLEHVVTEVVNEPGLGPTLVVRWDVERVEATLPLQVTVTLPSLHHVRAEGGAGLDLKAVTAPRFDVRAGDGATVLLSGAGGQELDVALWGGELGGASLDARSFVVEDATVDLSGGALAQLHADAEVSGTVVEGSTLLNVGEGACAVSSAAGATIDCQR